MRALFAAKMRRLELPFTAYYRLSTATAAHSYPWKLPDCLSLATPEPCGGPWVEQGAQGQGKPAGGRATKPVEAIHG